jgi:hypothetical protein
MIKATLETQGLKFEGKGESIDEAIADIGLDYIKIKAKGIITIQDGKRKAEKLFMLRQLRRMFLNDLTRKLWAKRLELFLK